MASGVKKVTATIAGQTVTLTKQSNGSWTGTFTAPSRSSGSGAKNPLSQTSMGATPELVRLKTTDATAYNALKLDSSGTYKATVKATDYAGNSSTGDGFLTVKEKTAPTCTIASPSTSATWTSSSVVIAALVEDDESGVDVDEIYFKLDNGDWVKVESISDPKTYTDGSNLKSVPYQVTAKSTTYTNVTGGSHTVYVKAKNTDGVESTPVSATFNLDSSPPEININSISGTTLEGGVYYTNGTSVTVTGTTSDTPDATKIPTVYYRVGAGTAQRITVGTGGTFSQTISLADAGSYTLSFWAVDQANNQSKTVTRTVVVDRTPPTISTITFNPNPSGTGGSVTITVTLTDA